MNLLFMIFDTIQHSDLHPCPVTSQPPPGLPKICALGRFPHSVSQPAPLIDNAGYICAHVVFPRPQRRRCVNPHTWTAPRSGFEQHETKKFLLQPAPCTWRDQKVSFKGSADFIESINRLETFLSLGFSIIYSPTV